MLRRARVVELPGEVMDLVEAVRARDGDASLVACLTRLVQHAAGDPRFK